MPLFVFYMNQNPEKGETLVISDNFVQVVFKFTRSN